MVTFKICLLLIQWRIYIPFLIKNKAQFSDRTKTARFNGKMLCKKHKTHIQSLLPDTFSLSSSQNPHPIFQRWLTLVFSCVIVSLLSFLPHYFPVILGLDPRIQINKWPYYWLGSPGQARGWRKKKRARQWQRKKDDKRKEFLLTILSSMLLKKKKRATRKLWHNVYNRPGQARLLGEEADEKL